MRHRVFELQGTPEQQAIAKAAIDRTTYPWEALAPAVRAQTGTRDFIPVDWADLSRYAQQPDDDTEGHGHLHVHTPEGDVGHPISRHVAGRHQVLGLAWYSLQVTLHNGLTDQPELAQEVLLAEGAHMVDFTVLTPAQRLSVFGILHDDPGNLAPDHGHGWFEETGNEDYWSWVGEGFMGAFTLAYSDLVPDQSGFDHQARADHVAALRAALTPFYGSAAGTTYHDSHRGVTPRRWYVSAEHARAEGRRPCGVCRPA